MFTWICPTCGAAVDVAKDICPQCGSRDETVGEEAEETLVLKRPLRVEPTVAGPSPGTKPESKPHDAPKPRRSPPTPAAAPRAAWAFQLRIRHLMIFAGALALAIYCAVWFSTGSMPFLSTLRFEDPEEMSVSPVETFAIGVRGPIEVSGIRPYYTAEYQMRVLAFVANHSEQEQSVALKVSLRVREASQRAPPLASFDVVLGDPLPPNGGQEVDVDLDAMGSLQSLPPWDELRVDLEVLGVQGR